MAGNDIVQTPFTPLGAGQDAPTGLTGVASPPAGSALPGEEAMLQQIAQDKQSSGIPEPGLETFFGPSPIDKARAHLQQADAAANGFWPTFLAVGAALKGSFGPALQLQQQKRQTAAAKAMLPFMDEINRLKNQGDFQGMRSTAEQYANEMGTRFPEAAQLFKGVADRAAKTEEDFLNTTAWFDIQKGKLTGPDDIRAPMVKTIEAVLKKRPIVGMEMIKEWAKDLEVRKQDIGGTVMTTTPGSTEAQFAPAPVYAKPGEQEDIVGNLVAGQHGITTTELTNVLNRVQTGKGSDQDKQITQDYITMLPFKAQLEARRLAPAEPAITTQQSAQGVPLVDIAAGTQPGQIQQAIVGHQGRLVEQAEAQGKGAILAQLLIDPFRAANQGFTPVNIDPDSDTMFSNAGPMSVATYNTLNQGKERVRFIPTADYNKVVVPSQYALEGLKYLGQMQASYGYDNASTPLNRMEAGINRLASDWLGVPLAPGMTVGKVAQAIVNRSLEQLEQTQALPAREVGELKRLMTGLGTDKEALDAANLVAGRIRQNLARVVGKYTVSDDEVVRRTGGAPAVPAQAPAPAPGQPITPGPGAAPGATTLTPNRRIQQDYKKWKVQ